MSKASEYAVRVATSKDKPSSFINKIGHGAHVTEEGGLWISTFNADAEDALRLADWIYDTFGEGGREVNDAVMMAPKISKPGVEVRFKEGSPNRQTFMDHIVDAGEKPLIVYDVNEERLTIKGTQIDRTWGNICEVLVRK